MHGAPLRVSPRYGTTATAEPFVAIAGHQPVDPFRNSSREFGLAGPGDPAQIPRRDRHDLEPGIGASQDFAVGFEDHRVHAVVLRNRLIALKDVYVQRLMSAFGPPFRTQLGRVAQVAPAVVKELPSHLSSFYSDRQTMFHYFLKVVKRKAVARQAM